jgi:transcriptional antiterminator Rof (Rho-off)
MLEVFLQESLLYMIKLREEVDIEKGRWRRDNPYQEKELEVCIRAKNNAWVIAKVTRGKELYMVLEKANETLLYATDAVEKFSNRLLYISVTTSKSYIHFHNVVTR